MQKFSKLLYVAAFLFTTISQACPWTDVLDPDFIRALIAANGDKKQIAAALQPFCGDFFGKYQLTTDRAKGGAVANGSKELTMLAGQMVTELCFQLRSDTDVRELPTFQFMQGRVPPRCYESATGDNSITLQNFALYLQNLVKTLQWLVDAAIHDGSVHLLQRALLFADSFSGDADHQEKLEAPQDLELELGRASAFLHCEQALACLNNSRDKNPFLMATEASNMHEGWEGCYWLLMAMRHALTAKFVYRAPVSDFGRILCLGKGHLGEVWAQGPAAGITPIDPSNCPGRMLGREVFTQEQKRAISANLNTWYIMFGVPPFKRMHQPENCDGFGFHEGFLNPKHTRIVKTEQTQWLCDEIANLVERHLGPLTNFAADMWTAAMLEDPSKEDIQKAKDQDWPTPTTEVLHSRCGQAMKMAAKERLVEGIRLLQL